MKLKALMPSQALGVQIRLKDYLTLERNFWSIEIVTGYMVYGPDITVHAVRKARTPLSP